MKQRSTVFYGWWIVAAGFATLGITYGFRYYVFGVFLKPMSAELGWDRASTAAVYSVSMILEYALAFLVGRIVDRYGPRIVMTLGALVAAGGFMSISVVTELWQYYLLYGLVTTIGVAMVGVIPVNTALANWFSRKRGTAMGIASSAISVGGIVLVPSSTLIIERFGWRLTWIFLGIVVLVVITPVAALVMRRRPEDMGLLPDGVVAGDGSSDRGAQAITRPEKPWTLREAMHTRTFWNLIIASGLASMPVGVFAVHVIPFATDVGIEPMAAAAAVSLASLVAFPGRIFYGWLGDRVDRRHVLMLVQTGLLVGFIALLLTDSPARLYLGVIVTGMFLGGNVPVVAALTAHLFGRRAMGSIYGLQSFLSILIYSLGPTSVGFLYDATGSYHVGFAIMIVVSALACVATYLIRPPQRQTVVLATER